MTESPNGTRWSDYARYLLPEHLEHKPITATIKAIVAEEMYSPKDKRKVVKPVLYMEGRKIGLPLSDVNQRVLCRLFGNDVSKAIGQRIILRPTKRSVGGVEKEPIYIEAAPAEAHTSALTSKSQATSTNVTGHNATQPVVVGKPAEKF